MTSGQWQGAWRIFNSARELPAGQQRSFVESATSESEVARLVFELLDEVAEMETPEAFQVDRTGTRVGRYRVEGLLGRGGMGEVYAARDTELNRRVALKFLLPQAIGDPMAVKRFVREAKAASALNHPNILTIHEVIETDPGLAIAMELVEGTPLNQLRGAALPSVKVIEAGRQVATALAAAHQHGIMHRDIKPENLMLRPDGFMKVLDFGLARGFGDERRTQLSVTGTLTGTLRYMSPEQLRGEALTGASDVFSLGIVLYELVAGVHPFDALYSWETAHAIHTRDARPPSSVNREAPAWLDDLILSMLNRNAALRPAASEIAARLSSIPAPARRQPYAKWVFWAASLGAAASVAWSIHYLWPTSGPKAVEFTQYPGDEDMPSFSPDGQAVAFVWNGPSRDNFDIYVRAIGSTSIERLSVGPEEDYSPVWSPDGLSIAFLRKQPNGERATILVVPAGGGAERKVADISMNMFDPTGSLAWTPDGKWFLVPARENEDARVGLFRVSAADGTSRRLTMPPLGGHDIAPALAPDGRMVAFVRSESDGVHSIQVLSLTPEFLTAGEPRLLPSFSNLRLSGPQWTLDAKELLFAANPQSGTAIWRLRVPVGGEAAQPPRRESYAERSSRIRLGAPSASAHRLMYSTEVRERNVWRVPLGSPAASVQPQRLGATGENHGGARVSPDGSRMVFESMRTGSSEIWAANIDGSQTRQLTNFGGPATGSAEWSPDGRRIAFDSRTGGKPHVYVIPAHGGSPTRITEPEEESYLPSWSHDGQWIYFCTPRSGDVEIWRRPDAGGPAEQVTHGGGRSPAESADGAFLYYQRRVPAGWALRRLTLKTGEDIEILPAMAERAFDVARDGIYYVPAPGPDGRFAIQFYDLKTASSRLVMQVLRPVPARLGLSPDGSFLLYSQLDRWGQDLMLVENFR